MSDQGTVGAGVHLVETPWDERIGRVPSVNVRLALVPEEERAAIVRAQEDHLLRLGAEVVDLPVRGTIPQMLGPDREHTAAAQVGEDQAGAAVWTTEKGKI